MKRIGDLVADFADYIRREAFGPIGIVALLWGAFCGVVAWLAQ
jgi:hypothetical protein